MNNVSNKKAYMALAVLNMYASLRDYANAYQLLYGKPVSSNDFIGKQWLQMWGACLGFLNGEIGDLDRDHLEGKLLELRKKHGFSDIF